MLDGWQEEVRMLVWVEQLLIDYLSVDMVFGTEK